MKCTSSILEEAYQQRVNVGYFKSQGVSRFSGSQSSKSRVMHKSTAMTLNSLEWENAVYLMNSASSGIKKFIEVNYNDDTIEDMRPDCLSAKLRKMDPDQMSFS